MRKWRVWCEDDTKFVEAWSMAKPTLCPENGAHVITAAKTCIVDDECHCCAIEINEQTGTSYTATYTDTFKYVLCTNAAAFALTIDPESSEPFSIGSWFYVVKGGAGDVTLTEGSGVAISGDKVVTRPFARVKVVKKAANVWHASGETAHGPDHTDGTDDVQDATSGQKGLATAAQITKLDTIEALADVTDSANVNPALTALQNETQLGEVGILLDAALSGDEKWSGIADVGTAGAALAVGDACYLASSGKWLPNDGILDGTDVGFKAQLGICILAAAGDTDPTKMLLYGKVRSAAFPAFTVGAPVYLDDTAGDLVVAQPSTTNFAIRIVGYAITAEDLLFAPSPDYIVHI